MPRQITQYRIFIGSPGGLTDERKAFQKRLDACSKNHGAAKNVHFEPVGWEDTVGGVGRPQELINRDLEDCDFAVFVFHDRWGSPTGKDGKVGTEEEWELAERLYEANKIRNIALFFKAAEPGKLADPGKQLEQVLAFRKRIEEGKRYLFHAYDTLDDFRDRLDAHLARWLDDHDRKGGGLVGVMLDGPADLPTAKLPPQPGFAFWIAETKASRSTPAVSLHFAEKALALATTDVEWADARNNWGIAKADLNAHDEAIRAFTEIAERLSSATDSDARSQGARALFNKGVTLQDLGRSDEAIAIYDAIIVRFAGAASPPIRELVAKALVNKGWVLGSLGRIDEAIAIYDDVVTRFASATEASIHESVAMVLVNKGVALGKLGRNEETIVVYDDVVTRFTGATEMPIREQVAKALFNKGVTLGDLGRNEETIVVYDDVVTRFTSAKEPSIRDHIAKALFNKGVSLGKLGRNTKAIAVLETLLSQFSDVPSSAELVPRANEIKRHLSETTASATPRGSRKGGKS